MIDALAHACVGTDTIDEVVAAGNVVGGTVVDNHDNRLQSEGLVVVMVDVRRVFHTAAFHCGMEWQFGSEYSSFWFTAQGDEAFRPEMDWS